MEAAGNTIRETVPYPLMAMTLDSSCHRPNAEANPVVDLPISGAPTTCE